MVQPVILVDSRPKATIPNAVDGLELLWLPEGHDRRSTDRPRFADNAPNPKAIRGLQLPSYDGFAPDEIENGMWLCSQAIPLPNGHNLPIGFLWLVVGGGTSNFLDDVAAVTKTSVDDFEWLRHDMTICWFRAVQQKPLKFAIPMYSHA